MSVSPTPTITPSSTLSSPSLGVLYLSVLALVILFVCVFVAFEYGRRMQRTKFDAKRLKEAVAIEEKQKLVQKLEDEKWSGPIDIEKNPLPFAEIGGYNANYFWSNYDYVMNSSDNPPSNKARVDYWNKIHALKIWGLKETQIYNGKTAEINKSKATSAEKKAKLDELTDSSWAGPIDANLNPFPPEAYPYTANYFWSHQPEVLGLPDDPPQNVADEDWKRIHALKIWGQKEQALYDEKRASFEEIAKEAAESRVPATTDMIEIGGLTFVLEFCTIMVIIFTLVILGMLEVLPGNEISAILAAIAGYVLGRAATTVKAAKAETAKTETAKTETAKTETAKKGKGKT